MNSIRSLFPQLELEGTYLDSAATTLKPKSVIDSLSRTLAYEVSNVHRGGHKAGNKATAEYEKSRRKVADFLRAKTANEIIFTRGTTESLNLVATTLSQSVLKAGDEIILSQLEHHSNIVPWRLWADRLGLKIRFVRVNDEGVLDEDHFDRLLNPKTKVVSLTHLSNALGVWVDVEKFFKKARAVGAYTVLDAAQSVSAKPLDVQKLDCDFLALSGHKLFGPTGIGVLYGRESLLNELPPYQGGGSMIVEVTEDACTYLPAPQRFEAGTPAIAEAIAFGAAIDFVNGLDWERIYEHDRELVVKTTQAVKELGFRVLAESQERSHVVSFIWPGVHPSDFAALLSEMDIAVRAGHHCCQPLMNRFQIPGSLRASFSIYSNDEDVARLVEGLKKAKELLI